MLEIFADFMDRLRGGSGDSDMPERRSLIRLRSRFKVTCQVGARKFNANIIDMGLGGMSLESYDKIAKGNELHVSLVLDKTKKKVTYTVDTVKCLVVWVRKSKYLKHYVVGVKYNDTDENMSASWVKYVLAKELGFSNTFFKQRRKQMRVPTDLRADIRNLQGEFLMNGTTLSLSMGGAMVRTDVPIKGGTPIQLTIGPYSTFQPLVIKSHVLGNRQDVPTKTHLHRISFTDTDPKVRALLGKYVRTLVRTSFV
jgi:c-di-GMP-binding flagellar brake protein YcgR